VEKTHHRKFKVSKTIVIIGEGERSKFFYHLCLIVKLCNTFR
jgi:hypothetical protein